MNNSLTALVRLTNQIVITLTWQLFQLLQPINSKLIRNWILIFNRFLKTIVIFWVYSLLTCHVHLSINYSFFLNIFFWNLKFHSKGDCFDSVTLIVLNWVDVIGRRWKQNGRSLATPRLNWRHVIGIDWNSISCTPLTRH